MNKDIYRICGYWGARREDSSEVASRVQDCFSRLSHLHPIYANWRDKWRSHEEWVAGPKPPWRLDLQNLISLVDSHAGKRIETGFTLGGWTGGWDGDDDASVSTTMAVGIDARHMAPNHFILELPSPSTVPGLYQPEVIRSAVEAVVNSWQPWWANFISSSLLKAQLPPEPPASNIKELQEFLSRPRDGRAKMPTIGWLSYLDDSHFDDLPTAELLALVKVEPGAHGAWLTLGSDPLDISEQDVVALRKLVQRPFHPHPFTGVEVNASFNFDSYRAQILGAPHASMKYAVDGYAFDGYRDGKLLYVHSQYEFQAEKGELAPAQLKAVFLPLAETQRAVARGTKIVWFFPQREVALDVQAALAEWEIDDIHVSYLA